MVAMEGMDAVAVGQMASALRSHSNGIGAVVTSLDSVVRQLAADWSGGDSADFVETWIRVHRPSLVAAEEAVAGMARAADENARQQVAASAAGGGGSFVGSGHSGVLGSAGDGFSGGVRNATRGLGWTDGILVGAIPSAIKAFSPSAYDRMGSEFGKYLPLGKDFGTYFTVGTMAVTLADGGYRLQQDIRAGHGAVAAEQALDTGGGEAIQVGMAAKNPVVVLAGVDTLIVEADVKAGSAIDWSELYHHPGELTSFPPGTWSAIWQSEKSGFGDLGKSIAGAF